MGGVPHSPVIREAGSFAARKLVRARGRVVDPAAAYVVGHFGAELQKATSKYRIYNKT